jgi:hypothetical protein
MTHPVSLGMRDAPKSIERLPHVLDEPARAHHRSAEQWAVPVELHVKDDSVLELLHAVTSAIGHHMTSSWASRATAPSTARSGAHGIAFSASQPPALPASLRERVPACSATPIQGPGAPELEEQTDTDRRRSSRTRSLLAGLGCEAAIHRPLQWRPHGLLPSARSNVVILVPGGSVRKCQGSQSPGTSGR